MDHVYAGLHGRLCVIQTTDNIVGFDLKQEGNAFHYLELNYVHVCFNPHDTRGLPSLDSTLPKGY